jgi:large subunit ribosomal protein L31e
MTSKKTKKITKKIPQEREYIVPLRREISKVPRYKKTPKAIKAVKQFLAKHMRIPDRDVSKIKLDKYLNQELWHRGIQNPPHKIKVKAKRQGENILVTLSELPEKWKYVQAQEEKAKQKAEKSKKKIKETPKEDKKEEKTEEEKKEEKEDEKSKAEVDQKLAQKQAKQEKHISGIDKKPKTTPIRKTTQK